MNTLKIRKVLLQTAKISVGSCIAIWLSEYLHLQNATSAGTIALLTIVATRWETFRLSLFRIITFLSSVTIAYAAMHMFHSEWFSYGAYIFLMILFCELMGMKSTISVNAVIGTHFLTTQDFSSAFIWNECCLILIGIVVAIILNFYHDNRGTKKHIEANMRYTESQFQTVFQELAMYLHCQEMQRSVWTDINELEKKLHRFINDAHEYCENTTKTHQEYYIDYFEMRLSQCSMLHNLHMEMRKIRQIPVQASIVADYLMYLKDFVIEKNAPDEQIEKLDHIFEYMSREPLPKDRAEFENRAVLYHILMDLEEFLILKKRFVENITEEQKREYLLKCSKKTDIIN